MRLLNVHNLQFHDFMGQDIPRYCILSHRWGDDEVSFKEFREGSKRDGEGYRKIYEFCQLVKRMPVHLDREGPWGVKMKSIDWVWIDTCTSIAVELKQHTEQANEHDVLRLYR